MDTLTDTEEATVLFESTKRKRGTVSPATSTGNDDDELKMKRARVTSSSISSEENDKDSSDHHESSERSSYSDEEESSEDDRKISRVVDYNLTRQSRNETEAYDFCVARELVEDVTDYYNDKARKNKDTMKAVKIKEVMAQYKDEEMMYFICFDAELITNEGKILPTNCRSVLFLNTESDDPDYQVLYIKHGSLGGKDTTKWTKHRSGRSVLYRELMEKKERPLDNEEEDVDTNNDDTDDVPAKSQELPRADDNKKEEDVDSDNDDTDDVPDKAQKLAQEAVADSNKKDVDTEDENTDDLPDKVQELAQEAVAESNKKEEDVDTNNDETDDVPDKAQELAEEAVADDNKKEEENVDTDNSEYKDPVREQELSEVAVGDENKQEDDDIDIDLIRMGMGVYAEIDPSIQEFAEIAVADYNNKLQEGNPMMKLGEIKEAFFRAVASEEYHINFDARFEDKDGQVTKETTCQAVVDREFSGPTKVWFFREGSEDEWCKDRRCMCKFPEWKRPSWMEILKLYPEWYPSSDDERELENKIMKPESSNQPPPASKIIWRDSNRN